VTVAQRVALACNCSICTKKGYLHLLVDSDSFVLERGTEALTTYTFNTHIAKHTFCSTCGIHPFYTPRSHPDQMSVNLRALDEDVVEQFRIEPFDGRNWEDNVHAIR
jgi:hypothetical protein